MPKYIVIVAISFVTIVFGSHCSARDLEPVDPAKVKAQSGGVSLAPWELRIGQVGYMSGISLPQKVRRIIDDKNLVAVVERRRDPDIEFRLSGFSTKGFVDGDEITIKATVKVTGTITDNGTTMFVIEPNYMTEKEIQAKAAGMAAAIQKQQARAKESAARKLADEKAKWRVWTDSAGAHTIEAQFKFLIGDRVKLVKKDGTEITIPLEKLSKDDQAWIKGRGKKTQ